MDQRLTAARGGSSLIVAPMHLAGSIRAPRWSVRGASIFRAGPIPRVKAWRAARTAIILLVVLTVCLPAMADLWYEHYARAEKALDEKKWTVAIKELNDAIERKADSGARVRSYGMKVISYFPYLKLGIAYYELGQYDAALQAFETEEKIGEVRQSQSDLAELQRIRSLVETARADQVKNQQERVKAIVQQGLADAKSLEGRDMLDEAMSALGRVLAVDPDNATAKSRFERLREKVAAKQRAREDALQRTRLLDAGRSALERGAWSEASSRLREALAIRDDAETRGLLDLAESGLRASIQSEADATKRKSIIADNLAGAVKLRDAGKVSEALDALQLVLAMEPSNADATRLHEELIKAKRNEDRSLVVSKALEDAEWSLGHGQYEEALGAANRALAFDGGNAQALEYVRRSYREINNRLLGAKPAQNIPPAIRFADFRTDRDGVRVQVVREPDFILSGMAIDDSPVGISCVDASGRTMPVRVSSQKVGDYTITEFKVERRLTPGSSTLRLVATDPGGQVASSEYEVLYRQPIVRALWFRLIAAAIPIVAFIVLLVARARRRTRLLKRRFNPYIAGAPVLDDDLFFGREALIERILQTIHNNSLLLHGERRIGKTSLQHQLRKRLLAIDDPKYQFYPVYVDLQGTREERFFSTLASDIFDELGPALDGLEPLRDFSGNGTYDYRDFVADLRRILERLGRGSERRVKLVLLIDEVDELNSYDPRINQKLRSLFMKNFAENLVSVVSGVQIKKQWEREGSPWYNFFEEIEVRPFRKEDAIELVKRPIRGVFTIDDAVVERIVDLTDCRPYLIQKHCAALINRMHETGRRVITMDDVEAVGRPEVS